MSLVYDNYTLHTCYVFLKDRWPWLEVLHEKLVSWVAGNTRGVLACSALRQLYRKTLVGTIGETPPGMSPDKRMDISSKTLFVLLHGAEELLHQRMRERRHAFMPPELLQSQLATLEPPSSQEHSIQCDISSSVDDILKSILFHIQSV